MMEWWQAVILGIIEGITEFLPISSTGHLTIAQKMMGMPLDGQGLLAFTAVIQTGAIIAAIIYFWKDIKRVLVAWWLGLWQDGARKNPDYRYGWAIILGSVPIAIGALLFRDQIETVFRSLWIVAAALIGWSVVLWLADKYGSGKRSEGSTTWKDTLMIGLVQVVALIPGISRSGATISAGLFCGFDRVSATRLSFFLGIPALAGAGIFEAITQFSHISEGVGWVNTILATIVSFVVGYATIAWLLRFIATNTFSVFIIYRVLLGSAIIVMLMTGVMEAV